MPARHTSLLVSQSRRSAATSSPPQRRAPSARGVVFGVAAVSPREREVGDGGERDDALALLSRGQHAKEQRYHQRRRLTVPARAPRLANQLREDVHEAGARRRPPAPAALATATKTSSSVRRESSRSRAASKRRETLGAVGFSARRGAARRSPPARLPRGERVADVATGALREGRAGTWGVSAGKGIRHPDARKRTAGRTSRTTVSGAS